MILAHKIALDATFRQTRYFKKAAGCDRFVWNLAVEEWDYQYLQYKESEKAGKPDKSLKPGGAKLKKAFNEVKYSAFPWMLDIHRDAHADPFERLSSAWSKHFKDPQKFGRPHRHKRGVKDSFYVANDKFRVIRDKQGSRVNLPVIGLVRMREDLRFPGKIMGAVVSRHGQRWFISIQVDVPDKQAAREQRPEAKGRVVGVDLGIKSAATINDGIKTEHLDGPKPLKKSLKKLKREERKKSRRHKGGSNRRKTVRRISLVHARIHDIRKDWLDKLTTRLCRDNQAVVIEDLNVKGMLRNEKLARALSDIGFGEFRRQMEYKAKLYKTHLLIVDRWFPSSKLCGKCGTVKESLTLKERVFHCGQCGHEIDRDENAAVNLRQCGLILMGRKSAKEIYPRLAGNLRLGRAEVAGGRKSASAARRTKN